MDDLAGLSFNSSTNQQKPQGQQNKPAAQGNYLIRSTPPISGRSTPALVPQSSSQARSAAGSSNPPSKPSTPAPDSFANLLAPQFNSAANNKNLSLQEQQRRLQEQKAKQAAPAASRQWDSDISALESYGNSRSGTPGGSVPGSNPFGGLAKAQTEETEDDILAAFNKEAPVDKSSHMPNPGSRPQSNAPTGSQRGTPAPVANSISFLDDDDDPFGLGSGVGSKKINSSTPARAGSDDDDVLGLLGKPMSELPPRKTPSPELKAASKKPVSTHPQERAVAELVDMGFSPDKAREALESTGDGLDVQAAVGWILNQAHAESKNKSSTPHKDSSARTQSARLKPQRGTSHDQDGAPAWMRSQDRSGSRPRREDNSSPANGEKDPAKMASEIGSQFFKTANSLWKTGAKRINKAVADFNTEGDSSQPKWMRDTGMQEQTPSRRTRQPSETNDTRQTRQPEKSSSSAKPADLLDMTDEAKMLESGGGRPQQRQRPQASKSDSRTSESPSSRIQSPFSEPKVRQEPASRSRIRQALEEESAQAYVSPARRKKATPKPPTPEPEPSLLFGSSTKAPEPSRAASSLSKPTSRAAPPTRPKVPTPTPSRPKAPPRNIPQLSTIALQSSTQHRLAGNAAFKLGNYSDAGTSYSASLRDLPSKHPLVIILLTNRALTLLKTGDPKASISDADTAIELIGPARGEGETIDTGTEEGKKDMQPFWGKAMMRRAEALEQLERWADASSVWKSCVEAGVGGAQAIQGRNRCERAANPAPARPAPVKARTTPAKPRPSAAKASALDDLSGRATSVAPGADSAAVKRMKQANAAAEKADDEKFRLTDSVDARLAAWRKGKEGNLRALLGSLDTVLWEGSGWKKVGMGDLIIPGKVKIAYMKGIGKVHPDKLPQTASTEQTMISQAVFSTLNEAWDRFKTENGL